MKRGARVGIAAMAALVLFVGGGIGLWKTTALSTLPAAKAVAAERTQTASRHITGRCGRI